MIRKSLLAGAVAAGLLMPGCLGPNHAYNTLRNWNAEATGHDWANELIFIGLNAIPVYGVALAVDAIALNTIDYWTGTNPFEDPGPFPDSFGREKADDSE